MNEERERERCMHCDFNYFQLKSYLNLDLLCTLPFLHCLLNFFSLKLVFPEAGHIITVRDKVSLRVAVQWKSAVLGLQVKPFA